METRTVEQLRVRVVKRGTEDVYTNALVVGLSDRVTLNGRENHIKLRLAKHPLDARDMLMSVFRTSGKGVYISLDIHSDDMTALEAEVAAGWMPDPPWPETPTPQPDADTNQENQP